MNEKFTLLSGNVPLPEALTPEEESYILQNSSESQVRNVLVEKNLRLVVFIAKKFENTKIPIDDLFSIGCIGLIKAADTFSAEKKIKFATYSSRCIENEILMFLRKNQKHSDLVSLDSPLSIDLEGNEFRVEDVVADTHTKGKFEEYENKMLIASVLTFALNTMHYSDIALILYQLGHLTQREMGDRLNCSQSYISRKIKKAIKTLKILSDKNLTITNPEIVFSFEGDFFCAKFFQKYFCNLNKKWTDFLSTHSLKSVTYEQNTDSLEFCSYSEEIFILVADFLLYLHT